MKKTLFLLAAFLLAAAALPAADAAPQRLAGRDVCLVTGNDYPPFCFAKPRNAASATAAAVKKEELETVLPGSDSRELQGYAWDLVRTALHAESYTLRLRVLSWREAATRAKGVANSEKIGAEGRQKGDYTINLNWGQDTYLKFHQHNYGTIGGKEHTALIFPVVRTPERDAAYVCSREPLFTSNIVAYVPRKSALAAADPAALAGRKTGFLKEYAYAGMRGEYAGVNPMEVDGAETGFNLLRSGRLEVLFGYERTFDFILARNRMDKLFRKIPTGRSAGEYLCGLRSDPRAAEVLAAFDAGMRKITADGRARRIAARWGMTDAGAATAATATAPAATAPAAPAAATPAAAVPPAPAVPAPAPVPAADEPEAPDDLAPAR